MSVEVGKYGRIILPKHVREKYGVHEGVRLVVTEYRGSICLVPVRVYGKPTEALFGAVKSRKPVEEPKRLARAYVRKKLVEDLR